MKTKNTYRSIEFIAYFQIEAVCESLRTMILSHMEPGSQTRKVLKSLRDELVSRTTGKPSERIPEVTDETNTTDLLTIAEIVRATCIAFMSPEEIEERSRIGFQAGEKK